jgi:hypothetical protein
VHHHLWLQQVHGGTSLAKALGTTAEYGITWHELLCNEASVKPVSSAHHMEGNHLLEETAATWDVQGFQSNDPKSPRDSKSKALHDWLTACQHLLLVMVLPQQ